MGKNCAKPEIGVFNRDTQLPTQTSILGCYSLLHFGYFLPKNICLGKNCAKAGIGVLNRDTQLPTQTSIFGCYRLLHFGYFLPKNICLGKNSAKAEIGVLNRDTQLATQFFWVNPTHLFLQCNQLPVQLVVTDFESKHCRGYICAETFLIFDCNFNFLLRSIRKIVPLQTVTSTCC